MKRLLAALFLLSAAPAFAQVSMVGAPCNMTDGSCAGVLSSFVAPPGCVSSSVPFFGAAVTLGCDGGITYDGTTDTLTVGKLSSGPAQATSLKAIAPATITITGATNATPIVVTAAAHGLVTGDNISISGITGNTNANGYFRITRLTADTFSLQNYSTGADIAGNGAYGGTPVAVTGIVQANRVMAGAGTEAAPSLSFSGVPGDGFFDDGTGIWFTTAGVKRGKLSGGNLLLSQDFNKGVVVGVSSDAGIWGIGTAAWAIGNGTAGNFSGSLKLNNTIKATAQGATWISGSVTELTTIAASATTDTTIDLPANAVIRAVVGRVTVQPPGTTTMTVGDPTTAARFATGISTAASTTFVGFIQADQTGAPGPRQTSTAKVRYTPNATPSDNTGRVRTVVFYDVFSPPTS